MTYNNLPMAGAASGADGDLQAILGAQ